MQVLVTFFMEEMFENNCLLKESVSIKYVYFISTCYFFQFVSGSEITFECSIQLSSSTHALCKLSFKSILFPFLHPFYHSHMLNPLHPDISMHILPTVLYIFPKMLSRRICLTIKSFFSQQSFSLFLIPYCLIQG